MKHTTSGKDLFSATEKELRESFDRSELICIDFPVVQFYLIYDDDGSICLEHKIFISTVDIIHLYNTTANFYRWVFVESINTPDWNLNTVMPPKTMMAMNNRNRLLE